MIKVDRYREENGKMIAPSAAWMRKARKKTKEAIEEGKCHHITGLYRDTEVKMALEKLFYGKCAYCERRLSAGDWDVEHFRPKGRVREREDHPGYYWLAYTWENLYPSCTSCNQRRKDPPLYDDRVTIASAGKGDQFPVLNEQNRVMEPAPLEALDREQPLLLDPCQDNPEKHLTYDILGFIHPHSPGDLRAQETIRVCHLNRRRLRLERTRTILRVSKLIEIIQLVEDDGDSEVKQGLFLLLEDYTDASAVYAGAARAVVKQPAAFVS